ncbi:aspartyl protease [Roseimicrobium gellanilyticum]|uniref:Aspartyl protease n=2 Tax=Roseimicrobium gellanilyticum TaxID=748857 RepID=A0A366HNX5_9BACT|nr:aspartyl protease [Roseimicrobium gellanilyticum]
MILVLGWMPSGCTSRALKILTPVQLLKQLPQGTEVIQKPLMLLTKPEAKAPSHGGHSGSEVSAPLRMTHGVPVIDAHLNGVTIPLIIDTGCQPTLMVDPESAVRASVLVVKPAQGSLVLEGTLGEEDALLGRVQQLSLTDWRIEGPLCLIRSQQTYMAGLFQRRKLPLNLFGMALPLHACSYMTIDYPHERVVFGFHQHYQPVKNRHVWSVPMILRDGLPHVRLRHGGVRWEAVIDTGANPTMTITPEIAQQCGAMSSLSQVDGYRLGIGVMSGLKDRDKLQRVVLHRIQGLGPELSHVPATIANFTPRVGSGLLRHYRVTLDFKRQLLWLEEEGLKEQGDPAS